MDNLFFREYLNYYTTPIFFIYKWNESKISLDFSKREEEGRNESKSLNTPLCLSCSNVTNNSKIRSQSQT